MDNLYLLQFEMHIRIGYCVSRRSVIAEHTAIRQLFEVCAISTGRLQMERHDYFLSNVL